MSNVVAIYSIDSDIDVIERLSPIKITIINLFNLILRLSSYNSIVFDFIDFIILEYF